MKQLFIFNYLRYFKFNLFISIVIVCSTLRANPEIDVFINNDIHYFSISQFCNAQDYKYIHYEDKSKVAILFDQYKITFSVNSSFAQVDQKTIHLLNNIIFYK